MRERAKLPPVHFPGVGAFSGAGGGTLGVLECWIGGEAGRTGHVFQVLKGGHMITYQVVAFWNPLIRKGLQAVKMEISEISTILEPVS